MTKRPRDIANDIIDCVETATAKWTKQKKSEERHPGNVRYRVSRMTREPRTTQKDAAWEVMEAAYMAASTNDTLPAQARQIYYQARPKIMAMTDDKELAIYFSQTLLPDYIEEHGVDWDVVYDARGHFEEPHTNRRIGCGTIEVRNYLLRRRSRTSSPPALPARGSTSSVRPEISAASCSCEKEGFGPLFKAVKLAERYDLMIVSTKGVSVTAARRLIDEACGTYDLPLFVLHDFDVAGFLILGTLQRDTRRYQFSNVIEVVDLGLRLDDIEGLEREPAAAKQDHPSILRAQLAENGAIGCRDRHPAQRTRRTERHDQRRTRRNDRAQAQAYGSTRWFPTTTCSRKPIAPSTAANSCGRGSRRWSSNSTKRPLPPTSRKAWSNAFARSSPSTPICGGTTLSRSCWTKRSFLVCERRRKRPKRNPGTSRAATTTI